jgi:hypothetical protein
MVTVSNTFEETKSNVIAAKGDVTHDKMFSQILDDTFFILLGSRVVNILDFELSSMHSHLYITTLH